LNKFILGSGIIGLIARHVLGASYTLIPFKRSRYYSFQTPVADDDIVYNEHTAGLLRTLQIISTSQYFPTAISMSGQLFFNKDTWSNLIVDKLYGDEPHPLASKLLSADIQAHSAHASVLYTTLLEKYRDDINSAVQWNIDSIAQNQITINGQIHDYDSLISTIPLNALLSLTKLRSFLKSKDYHVFIIGTDQFNLEGAQRCFIADMAIPFWKANVINNSTYQFFSNGQVEGADAIFSLLTNGRYQVLASTVVKEAFPCGAPPIELLNRLKLDGIECIGSNARWDYFYDIATSLNHILKIKHV
jgi:hypothetical protein